MHIASWTIFILLAAGPTVIAQSVDLHVVQTVAGTGYSGAPYSARETAITARIADDGTRFSSTTNMRLWRDSAGRTREEQWGKRPTGFDFHSVTVLDPVAGVSLTWQVSDDSARSFVTIMPLPAIQKIIEPVSSRFGLPPVNPPAAKAEPIPTGCANCSVKTEYLTSRPINGVHAVGLRTTRTYNSGTKENGQDFVAASTNETWTSPDLRINVLVINDQPDYGRMTLNVTDVVQGEPDPSLFQTPPGYQVRNGRGAMGQTVSTGAATTLKGSASAGPLVANALSGTG